MISFGGVSRDLIGAVLVRSHVHEWANAIHTAVNSRDIVCDHIQCLLSFNNKFICGSKKYLTSHFYLKP